MRIWTIQTEEVYQNLQKEKVLYVEEAKSHYITDSEHEKAIGCPWTFKDSYDWLVKEMKERVGNPPRHGVNYPWWGWYKYKGKNKKPDLRNIGLGNTGEYEYCIEIEIPDKEILLSDHDLWHCVLNDCEISHFEYESEELYEEAYNKYQEYLMTLSPETREKIKLNSWKEIFDSEYKEERDKDWTNRNFIQCNFWELRLDQVVRVQKFKCR